MDTKLYKVAEVATLFDVTPETVRRWARSGSLPSVKKTGSSHWLFSKKEIDDMIEEGRRPDDLELATPRTAIADRDYDLNSSSTVPSADYFVKIVYHIAAFAEKMEDVEIVDGPYDKKRDIIGYKRVRYQKRELQYIQCKKKKDITEDSLKKELKDLKTYLDDPRKQPLGLSLK
jgi:excisionase family DNA binding protein